MIAPFLLLPFIENSFKQSSDLTEQPWINMDISVEGDLFTMKMANGMSAENNGVQALSDNTLANVQKRLTLLYAEKYDLKITREPEMLVVLLKIHLTEKNISGGKKEVEHVNSDPAFTQPNIYAAQ
jgi:sensor histidine kinase YesM